jgi:hypothetical protein
MDSAGATAATSTARMEFLGEKDKSESLRRMQSQQIGFQCRDDIITKLY